jgi:hypothetical protein
MADAARDATLTASLAIEQFRRPLRRCDRQDARRLRRRCPNVTTISPLASNVITISSCASGDDHTPAGSSAHPTTPTDHRLGRVSDFCGDGRRAAGGSLPPSAIASSSYRMADAGLSAYH